MTVSAELDLVAPQWQWAPEYDRTYGPAVADLCAGIGFAPDPEQQLLLDATFAVDAQGRSIRDIGLCAPRQNLKTGFLKMAAIGWLFVMEHRLVTWSAHEFGTAHEAWRDMKHLIEDSPALSREILVNPRGGPAIKGGNNEVSIELKGDRRLLFKARTSSSGRGLSGDRVVLDEAMYLTAAQLASLVPTMRARPDPQMVYAGSAGLLQSDQWRRLRDAGRAGGDPRGAWFEWGDRRAWECADPECSHEFGAAQGCGLDDEDRLWSTNSALTRGRITMDSLRADRRILDPIKYATETAGWWEDPPTGTADDVLAKWPERGDPGATIAGPVSLGVAVSHDSRSAAIVACGAGPDGTPVVDGFDWRPPQHGTAWLADRLTELRQKHKIAAVAVVKGQPAESLNLPDVRVMPAVDFGSACVAFARAVAEGPLSYVANADKTPNPLDTAVGMAVRKFVGEGWRWSLRESRGDITPLVGAVVALALHSEGLTYDVLDSVPEL